MRLVSPASARSIERIFAVLGLACVAILTLVDRGATRAYSTPWNVLFWCAHVVPFGIMAVRALSQRPMLRLPTTPWVTLAGVLAVGTVVSALLSPFREQSLVAVLTPLAGTAVFVLLHDWIQENRERNGARLLKATGWFAVALGTSSLVMWCADLRELSGGVSSWLYYRNEHPLGHSNYTAGLSVLALPWVVELAVRTRGARRVAWGSASLLALGMLVTSGSRGGLIGLGALSAAALLTARLGWRRTVAGLMVAAALALALALAHPRTRAIFIPPNPAKVDLQTSNDQRSMLLIAGWRMGAARPLVGWGPGVTPLVYPKFRGGLDGGLENVLQLHSTPVQLWADLGLIGCSCMAGFLLLGISHTAQDLWWWGGGRQPNRFSARGGAIPGRIAGSVALAGYVTFALTDFQLDVPVFALAVAACAALVARSRSEPASATLSRLPGIAGLVVLAIVAFWGGRDQTAVLNSRAIEMARTVAGEEPAIALLRRSLERNPEQEIAHFNLGWLLVVRSPLEAERHFVAAARLVPDKGGVYFGVALARLNQGSSADRSQVVRALALECLNDPLFLSSPWWRRPAIAAFRTETIQQLQLFARQAAAALRTRGDARAQEALYVAALAEWMDGSGSVAGMLALSHTAERVRYFALQPSVPDFARAQVRSYRRERPGYPVLMRNLDLPPLVDFFDVQENMLAAEDLGFLFPPKGWLPSPLLLGLLDASKPANP